MSHKKNKKFKPDSIVIPEEELKWLPDDLATRYRERRNNVQYLLKLIARAKVDILIDQARDEISKSISELLTDEYWIGRGIRMREGIKTDLVHWLTERRLSVKVESPSWHYDHSGSLRPMTFMDHPDPKSELKEFVENIYTGESTATYLSGCGLCYNTLLDTVTDDLDNDDPVLIELAIKKYEHLAKLIPDDIHCVISEELEDMYYIKNLGIITKAISDVVDCTVESFCNSDSILFGFAQNCIKVCELSNTAYQLANDIYRIPGSKIVTLTYGYAHDEFDIDGSTITNLDGIDSPRLNLKAESHPH